MATAAVEEEEDVLTCTVCLDSYKDPCTLQCKHSFCRKCITDYTKTQRDAVRNKTIPCPSCRQVTLVPDPSRPVSRWAEQLKPGHVIQELMTRVITDTLDDTPCFPCHKLGQTTSAKFWCGECEAAFCHGCAKTHRAQPNSGSHGMHNIQDKGKTRRRKVRCREHSDKLIELYCKNCNVQHCHMCFLEHHRKCEDVVTLNSFASDMKEELSLLDHQLEEQEQESSILVEHQETRISQLHKGKVSGHLHIQHASQRAITLIKRKEKKLFDELDDITDRETNELKAKVKEGNILLQTYRQYREYIKQALGSDSEVEVCNVYQAWKSGQLEVSLEGGKGMEEENISSVIFSQENENTTEVIDSLHLGEIVRYLPTELLTRVELDMVEPSLRDVTVLEMGDVHTAVITDFNNECVKSFYIQNNKTCHSRLTLSSSPWGLARVGSNRVMVAVSDSHQIVTVAVTPDLIQEGLINTSKSYSSLALIPPSTLAAGGINCVDILNMDGEVLRSIKRYSEVGLYEYHSFICVSNTGHLILSDWMKKTVTCMTASGRIKWVYSGTRGRQLSNPRGVTATSEGDILVADRKKVIQLSEAGEFVRDYLTSQDGVCTPFGIFVDRHGSLFICDSGKLKVVPKRN